MNDPRQRMTPEQKAAMKMGHQIGQGFVTDDRFHKSFKKLVQTAKETFERDGYHSHMIIAYLRDNETRAMTIVPAALLDWPPPGGSKYEAMMGLGVQFAESHPNHTLTMVSHISEGWIAQYSLDDVQPGTTQLKPGRPNASQRADKIEVLTISLTTQDLRQSCTNLAIFRDDNGKFKRWGKKQLMEDLYDPDSDFMPMATGDQLGFMVIRGYIMARTKGRIA